MRTSHGGTPTRKNSSSSSPSFPAYLYRRGDIFYFRLRIPTGKQGKGVPSELRISLRTSYVRKANSLARHIYSELQAKGALNINLVTPTHYAPYARAALDLARERGMDLPVVWNTSGYETVRAVRENRGYADVYLTDYKYASSDLAARYSKAPNYPQVALDALSAMVDEIGDPCFDEYEGDERMTRGVVVRHLMLPGALEDSKRVVQTVWEHFGSSVLLSIMNQYTPVLAESAKAGDAWACRELERCSELARRVPNEDYERLLDFADSLGIEDYFWQEGGAAEESFIPAFDLEGVLSE